jgi:hypothetical protein
VQDNHDVWRADQIKMQSMTNKEEKKKYPLSKQFYKYEPFLDKLKYLEI